MRSSSVRGTSDNATAVVAADGAAPAGSRKTLRAGPRTGRGGISVRTRCCIRCSAHTVFKPASLQSVHSHQSQIRGEPWTAG